MKFVIFLVAATCILAWTNAAPLAFISCVEYVRDLKWIFISYGIYETSWVFLYPRTFGQVI